MVVLDKHKGSEMNQTDAKRAIIAKTNEVIALARSRFPSYVQPAPEILFNLRGRSVGGTALGHERLRFNLDWYAAMPEKYLSSIIPHEVAHIVANATGLGKNHNRGWQRICIALGGDGTRCEESADVKKVAKARRTREYLYNAERGQVWVGPVHHSRLQKDGRIILHSGREMYALRNDSVGRIVATGFTGQVRMKA